MGSVMDLLGRIPIQGLVPGPNVTKALGRVPEQVQDFGRLMGAAGRRVVEATKGLLNEEDPGPTETNQTRETEANAVRATDVGETPAAGDGGPCVRLNAYSDRYAPDSEAWADQELALFVELRRKVGGVRRQAVPVAGAKGTADAVLIALASSGAFTALVQCLQTWLSSRDTTRRVELGYEVDGVWKRVVLSASGIDDATFEQLKRHLLGQLERGE